MGRNRIASASGHYSDPSSIIALRALIKKINDHLDIIGSTADDLPDLLVVGNMVGSFETFVEDLRKLRDDLDEQEETCEELHKEIRTIEMEFEENGVIDELTLFIQDLRRWTEKPRDRGRRKEAISSRRLFRDCVQNFPARLSEAVDTRCIPGIRQVS